MTFFTNLLYTKHMFTKKEYKTFGIRLIRHIFKDDEFILPEFHTFAERDANELIRALNPEAYHQRIRQQLNLAA